MANAPVLEHQCNVAFSDDLGCCAAVCDALPWGAHAAAVRVACIADCFVGL